MNHQEKLKYLIKYLINENSDYRNMKIPTDEYSQKRLLRSLMNVRMPKEIAGAFLTTQDEYLKAETKAKGITDIDDLTQIENGIYLWQGDITTLKCDGIVNAANSQMLGCFCPCHGCIDNVIHTFSGVQLRLECAEIMKTQGHDEPVGNAKITRAYNLPCSYILHTVGPIVYEKLTEQNKEELASCYLACLRKADENGLKNLAFCCISTGEFHFPNDIAAKIAVETVKTYLKTAKSDIKVIFNVFKDLDYEIYRKLLG